MKNLHFVYIFCLVVGSLALDAISSDIVIKNADRQIDISSQLAKIATKLTLENTGKSPVKAFLYSVEPQLKKLVAFVGSQVSRF